MRELDRANSSAAVAAQSSGPGTNPVPGNRSKGTAGKSPANGATSPAKPAMSGKELTLKREADKQLRKAERDVERAEERRSWRSKKQIAGMDKQMADPAAHGIDLSDGTLYAQYNELKDRLTQADLPLGGAEHRIGKRTGSGGRVPINRRQNDYTRQNSTRGAFTTLPHKRERQVSHIPNGVPPH